MASCGKGTLTRKHPDKLFIWQFLAASCKKLTCPSCGPAKAAAYRKAVYELAQTHGLRRHVVLTLDPGLIPPGIDSVEYIQQVWANFRTYLAREHNLRLTYIRVLEFQANGTAHFHLLIHETVAQDTLLQSWVGCGGGHQVRIRFRDGQRGAMYITKYLTKNLLCELPPGHRVITTARKLRLFEPRVSAGWKWNRYPLWIHLEFAGISCPAAIEAGFIEHYVELDSPPYDEGDYS